VKNDDGDDDGRTSDASWGWNDMYLLEDVKSIDLVSTSASVEHVNSHKEMKLHRESPKFDSMYSILSIPLEYEDDYDDFY